MMNLNQKQKELHYWLVLATGAFARLSPRLFGLNWVTEVLTFFWLSAFLFLCCAYRKKKELLLTGAVFCLSVYLREINTTGMPLFELLVYLPIGLLMFSVFLLYSYVLRKWDRLPMTLLFPLLWMSVYYVLMWLRIPTVARIDVMFIDLNVLIQSEGFLGSTELSVLLLWMVALVSFAMHKRSVWCGILAAVVIAVPMLIGLGHLYPNLEYPETVRVAYATGPYIGDFLDFEERPIEDHYASVERSAKEAAASGAGILVFNEEAFGLSDANAPAFLAYCSRIAQENRLHMLVGLDVADTDGSEGGKALNEIIWIDAEGAERGTYVKAKLLPILESGYVLGKEEVPSLDITVDGRQIRVSYLICYDSNFPDYISRMDKETDILFLPSWDWTAVAESHSKLCRLIAIENRVTLLKPTYDGYSIAVDPEGRVIHKTSTAESGYETVHIVELPIRGENGPVVTTPEKSPHIYAYIAAEIMSILICLALLYGNIYENPVSSLRCSMFSIMIFSNIIALLADALSWILDGCANLDVYLNAITLISIIMILIIGAEFIAYMTAFIREREPVPDLVVRLYYIGCGIMIVGTLAAWASGKLYQFENGVYSDGPLYPVYVFINALAMGYSLVVVFLFREALGSHDFKAAYLYMIVPLISAGINLFIPEWSFAYPAITLSLVIVYVMIQSDRLEQMAVEGKTNIFYATHDMLTGLNNRRAYDEKLLELQMSDDVVGVVYTDMNGLKVANDTYGHAAGDALISKYTSLICGVFRREETYRIGGDEFVVILPKMKRESFDLRMLRFREVLNAEERPPACIGYAYGSSCYIQELLKDAEEQMYVEKEAFHRAYPDSKR